MEPLKPCPFCGGTAMVCHEDAPEGGVWHEVQCIKCGSAGKGLRLDEADAIAAWNRRALLPAASGWVEVTDDQRTWPGGDPTATCLVECNCGHYEVQHGAWDVVCFGDECAAGEHRGCRHMPWPSASAPAACGHGAILREAAEDVAACAEDADVHDRAIGNRLLDIASRLRAAADAAGKEGK